MEMNELSLDVLKDIYLHLESRRYTIWESCYNFIFSNPSKNAEKSLELVWVQI